MSSSLLAIEKKLDELQKYAEHHNINALQSNINSVSAEVLALLNNGNIQTTMTVVSKITPFDVRGLMNTITTKINNCDGKDDSYFKSMKKNMLDLEHILATIREDLNRAPPNSGGRRRTRRNKRTHRSKSRRSKSRRSRK